MSTDEFQQMWKAYDVKLEKSLRLNLRLFQEVQSQKARSALRSLTVSRVIGIVIGILYVVLLVFAFWYVRTQPVMAVSFAVFIICSVIAIGMYIRELGVIRTISYGGNIVDTQQKKKPDMADKADISLDIHRVRYKVVGKIQKIFYSGVIFWSFLRII